MEPLRRSLAFACNPTPGNVANSEEARQKYQAEISNQREGHLHLQDGYVCETCRNKGYMVEAVYVEELGYWTTVERECDCMNVRKNMRRLKKSGLQDEITRCRFDNYEAEEPWQNTVKTTAQQYVETVLQDNPDGGRKGWFFIGGTSGAGKSHICTAICGALLHHGKELQYMEWRNEAVRLKAIVNEPAEYQKTMDYLKNVEVLYIDDFFKSGDVSGTGQRPTDGDVRLAFELLHARYRNPNTITIISSESALHEIHTIDQAIGGRIGERAGKQYILNLIGMEKNYRQKLMGVAL